MMATNSPSSICRLISCSTSERCHEGPKPLETPLTSRKAMGDRGGTDGLAMREAIGARGRDKADADGNERSDDGFDDNDAGDGAMEPEVALVDADLEEADGQSDHECARPHAACGEGGGPGNRSERWHCADGDQMLLKRASTRLMSRSSTKPTSPMVMMQRIICS